MSFVDETHFWRKQNYFNTGLYFEMGVRNGQGAKWLIIPNINILIIIVNVILQYWLCKISISAMNIWVLSFLGVTIVLIFVPVLDSFSIYFFLINDNL